MSNEKVIVEIGAQDDATPTLNRVADATASFGDKAQSGFGRAVSSMKNFILQGIGIGSGIAIYNKVSEGIKSIVNAGIEAQTSMARVNATLATMGEKGEAARGQIEQISNKMIKFGFDNNDTSEAMAKLFQRTGDVEQAYDLLQVSTDLARAKQIDLGAATNLVGQVLSGNGKVLKQYGIDLKEAASPMEALQELQGKVAGQTEAYSKTWAGQMDRLKATWGSFLEQVGVPLLEIVGQLMTKFLDWFDSIGGSTMVIENFKMVIDTVAPVFKAMWAVLDVIFKAIGTAIELTYLAWLKTSRFFSDSAIVIGKDWKKMTDVIKEVTDFIVKSVTSAWSGMMTGISNITTNMWEGIKSVFKAGINAIINFLNQFIAAYKLSVEKIPGAPKIDTFKPLAEGGIVTRPTLAMVGEAGDEAVIPLNKARNKLGGLGGGITVLVQDNNFYGSDEEFAQKVGDQIIKSVLPHLSFQTT